MSDSDHADVLRRALRGLAVGQDPETAATLLKCAECSDEALVEFFSLALYEADEDPEIARLIRDCAVELESRRQQGAGHA